jgi:MFS family permease
LTRAESLVESRYAWARLCAALALMTIGGSGMYAITVVLPRVQADFGVSRSDASLPYTLTMIGFGLGYGPTRGAEMLSLMLGFGIVSRLASGWISDRIGGLRTLLLGSTLQGIALLLFLPFKGLVSLYVVSALFGLFQGGIVPAYPLIVREHFSPREAGARVGTVLMATLFGMALGGWMSGAIFDLTGSYRAAFVNGIAWNLVNLGIVAALLYRSRARAAVPG